MAEFQAHVLVCTNSEGAEDKRHCGDKGGHEVRRRFNEALARHGLLQSVTICDVGCTSQHKACEEAQGSVVIYGPTGAMGGTWYNVEPDDVEEVVTEHLVNGRKVSRLVNEERSVALS